MERSRRRIDAYHIANALAKMDKEDDIEVFGPKILELMRGVPWDVFIELDEKPGRYGYMNDRFYMLRRVRNSQEWGTKLFDGLTEPRAPRRNR